MTKKTSPAEILVYEKMNQPLQENLSQEDLALKDLSKFTPKFYRKFERDGNLFIEVENLLAGAPNASFADIKMGTSTVTQKARDRQDPEYL